MKYKYFQSLFNLDTKLLLFLIDMSIITTVNVKLWSFPVQERSESGNGLLPDSNRYSEALRRAVPHRYLFSGEEIYITAPCGPVLLC